MRSLAFLLIAGLTLVLMAGEAEAKGPEWNYTSGSGISSVDISADGEFIAAGDNNGKVYLFNQNSSTPLWSYSTGDTVYSVAISADGEYIAAGSMDNHVYFFSKDSGTPLWNYGAANYIWSVAVSDQGDYIAAGSWDNRIYLFGKNSSTPIWSYNTGNFVLTVDISPDGEFITGGSDKVYFFGQNSSTPLWSYSPGTSVRAVAISDDNEYLAAGTWDSKVYYFHTNSSTPLWNYTADDAVYSIATSDGGEYVVAGTKDYMVYLLDGSSGASIWSYSTGSIVSSVDISANGDEIVAGSDQAYLFGKESSEPLWSYVADDVTKSIRISADGQDIVSGASDSDKRIYLFDKDVPPTAHIDSIEPGTIRFDENVVFSGSGTGVDVGIVAYQWISSIDGFLSDEQNFTVSYLSDGVHTISLSVQDEKGEWSDWVTSELTVIPNALPVATINSISPAEARFDTSFSFNGSGTDSDGTVVGYEWVSSLNELLSNTTNFDISGLRAGTHTISFRVQDNDGAWSDWNNSTLVVYPNELPVAMINSVNPSPASEETTLFFTGSGTDSDGTVVGYEWSSSIDGILSNDKAFNMSGLSAGTHTLSFQVQDNDGGWSEWASTTLVVNANIPPVGTIVSITPLPAELGTMVSFSGAGIDSDGTIIGYQWISSIDGVLSPDKNFSSSGLSLGKHTVTFQAQDSTGTWGDVDSRELVIGTVPAPNAGTDSEVTIGGEVQFIGLGNDADGTIVLYEWDVDGDGEYDWSDERHGITTHIYTEEGTYTAVLRLTDNDGFTATDSVVITISKPVVDDDGGGLPSVSMISALVLIGLIAIYRRK